MAELKRKAPWDPPQAQVAPLVTVASSPATLGASKEKPRRINFDVPPDVHRRLRIKAASEGVTIAEVGRQLLEEWLAGS